MGFQAPCLTVSQVMSGPMVATDCSQKPSLADIHGDPSMVIDRLAVRPRPELLNETEPGIATKEGHKPQVNPRVQAAVMGGLGFPSYSWLIITIVNDSG